MRQNHVPQSNSSQPSASPLNPAISVHAMFDEFQKAEKSHHYTPYTHIPCPSRRTSHENDPTSIGTIEPVYPLADYCSKLTLLRLAQIFLEL
jgi:hypothetical protein